MKESISTAGTILLDSTVGTANGIVMGAWPLFLVGFVTYLAVAIVSIPKRLK